MPVTSNDILEVVGGDQAFRDLVDATAQAAGRAEAAARYAGGLVAFGGGTPINPISNWRASFNPIHTITPGVIENYCQQLIGRLEQLTTQAQQRERGLVGLIAAFLRFPDDVREAIGEGATRRAKRSAFAVAVAAQVVGALIVAAVITLIGVAVHHAIH